ncbi:MAG: hypothetical protein ABIH21_01565, partial [Patescibacteria group bacterium]
PKGQPLKPIEIQPPEVPLYIREGQNISLNPKDAEQITDYIEGQEDQLIKPDQQTQPEQSETPVTPEVPESVDTGPDETEKPPETLVDPEVQEQLDDIIDNPPTQDEIDEAGDVKIVVERRWPKLLPLLALLLVLFAGDGLKYFPGGSTEGEDPSKPKEIDTGGKDGWQEPMIPDTYKLKEGESISAIAKEMLSATGINNPTQDEWFDVTEAIAKATGVSFKARGIDGKDETKLPVGEEINLGAGVSAVDKVVEARAQAE